MKLFKLFAVTLMLWPYLGIALLYLPEDAAPYLFFSLYLLLTAVSYTHLSLIRTAYGRLQQEADRLAAEGIPVTDDAMAVETLLHHPIKLFSASYENIKITTPEDLITAEGFLEKNNPFSEKAPL